MAPARPVSPRDEVLARWDDVRVFLAALRAGSFTKAALELGTDQSTVSRRIAALEGALAVTLFERTRRAPVPTEAGERLREAAEEVEGSLARFSDAATGLKSRAVEGRVRLALTEELAVHFVVPHVLPKLRADHPGLFVDLTTSYRAVDLGLREADIALRFFQTEKGNLVGRRIARFRTAVLASRAYARRARTKSLADLDWIAVELAGIATPESAWLSAHVPRPPVLTCSSYQTQVAAIRAGMGVGVGPLALTRLETRYTAIELRPRPEMPILDLYVVTRSAIRAVPRVAAVMDALGALLAPLGDAPA